MNFKFQFCTQNTIALDALVVGQKLIKSEFSTLFSHTSRHAHVKL